MGLGRALASAIAFAPAPGAAAQTTTAGGMTAEQDLRQNPQPPRDIKATRRADGTVEISWAPPPEPPVGPLMYERSFARFRVYRLDDGRQTPIAETTTLHATDPAPAPGSSYLVVTVQRDGREGSPPDPVAQIPR